MFQNIMFGQPNGKVIDDMTKQEQKAADEATAASTSQEENKATDDKVTDKKETDEKVDDASKPTDTDTKTDVDPDDFEKDADGNFVWKVDPENPNSTVYKAATRKELLKIAQKGIADKDNYIRELKTKSIKANERDSVKGTAEDKISDAPPEYRNILTQVVDELKVDPQLFRYTDEQWRELELEKGAIVATRLYRAVETATQLANQRYDEQNVIFINNTTLEDETESVRELLKDSEIDPESFDYEKVLDAVWKDEKAWKANGVRKNGVIVTAAAKAIRELTKSKLTSKVSKEKDEELAKTRLEKKNLNSEGKTKAKVETGTKQPKDINDAHRQVLEDWKAGKYKV